MTRVKICGITRMEDAEWALECGADMLGFVFEPSSPRYVGDKEAASTIPHRLGLFARCIAVFGDLPPKVALPFGYAAVQATVGDNFPDHHWAIRSFRTAPDTTAEEALKAAEGCQGLLIDAFHPTMHGGTGKLADWEFASRVVRTTDKPILLAGGLTPDNVAAAVSTVNPYAVDVSSGVEAGPGIKDRAKVRDFIQAARSA